MELKRLRLLLGLAFHVSAQATTTPPVSDILPVKTATAARDPGFLVLSAVQGEAAR
jgi:hypothetical protein